MNRKWTVGFIVFFRILSKASKKRTRLARSSWSKAHDYSPSCSLNHGPRWILV